MIVRSKGQEVVEASRRVPDLDGRPIEDWLTDDNNIALVRGDDVCLFDYQRPGVYCGHYFFSSRGKEAVIAAEDFLAAAFNEYGVRLIMGVTPLYHKGALWMNRRLGFTSQFREVISSHPCEIFTLSKKDYHELRHQ